MSDEKPVYLTVGEGSHGPEFVLTLDASKALQPVPVGFLAPADAPRVSSGAEPTLSPETCQRCVIVADGTRYLCALHRPVLRHPTLMPIVSPGTFIALPSDAHTCTDPGR